MSEKKRPTVYFSNKLELLAQSLGEELWQKGTDPFAKRIVILPHHSLKSYLSSFFARHLDWNISMGVEYKILIEGVKTLVHEEVIFPSELALSFAIEQEIQDILQQNELIPLFSEVKKYVGVQKNEDKIRWLACELSRLFYEYGMFEAKALSFWLGQNGFEQEIWKRIFTKFSKWRTLSEQLPHEKGGEDGVHLFGFSHIPSHFYDFFCKFSAKFYFLSPSEMFWEDLCSDKERLYLEKKMEKGKVKLQIQEQLRFFLTKTHPLLANWGRLGRPLLARFGQVECYLEERYSKESAPGVLGHIQSSLLELEDDVVKKQIAKEDTSLLCISASSKLREVEILSQTLQELIQKSSLEPKDVLVLVSDLKSYLPYIHAVFGSIHSPFSYSVHGLFSKQNPRKGITSFLPMVEERFSLDSVFTFISLPSVMNRWEFTHKDLLILRKWCEHVYVLWGLCPQYKKECLQKTAPGELSFPDAFDGGTWQEGIKKLLYKLAHDEKDSSFSIEWTQADLLGRFIHLINTLQNELKPVYEEEKRTFSEWISFLRKWSEIYHISNQEEESLWEDLENLHEECREISESLIPFASFIRAIDSHFERKKESFQSSHLQAVKFLSLEMGSASPSPILYVLGCDEESFPRSESPHCFEKSIIGKETPSFSDQSRYIFLELLLHARSSLVFSYSRISSQDQKKQGPCRMIEELFSYLDARFFFPHTEEKPSKVLTRDHPTLSFSKEYFGENTPWVNFSSQAFSLAKSYYDTIKEPLSPFFPSWQGKEIKQESLPVTQEVVEISKLQGFARNPIRFYFQEKLGIFFDVSMKEDKEFFLSAFMQRKIMKKSLKSSLQDIMQETQVLDHLPLGPMRAIAQKDLIGEAKKWKESLCAFGLQEKDLFSIEFVDGVRFFEKREDRMIVPPLVIGVEGIGFVSIQGHLPYASPKGLIWFGKKTKEEYTILWPSFLIFLCVARQLSWEEECLFIQEGKRLSFSLDDPYAALAKYLKLYMRSLEDPCPISPSLSMTFLEGSEEELKKKMTPSSYESDFTDPYEQWLVKRDPPPTASYVQKKWKNEWEEVFSFFLKGAEK